MPRKNYMHRIENGAVSEVQNLQADIVVVGGGLAGVSAAISAARFGAEVILVQERSVLGGNSSSEIRVGPSGATGNGYHRDARETGIIEEMFLEARSRSYGLRQVNGNHYPMWDVVLEEKVRAEPRIRLLMDTRVISVETEADPTDGYRDRITGLTAAQQGTEEIFHLQGQQYVDATGDGFVALQAGSPYRYGRESRDEYDEWWAPEIEDDIVLGSSILFAARDVGRPVPFTPPEWASKFHDEESLPYRSHTQLDSGYWWIEWGGRKDTIKDNEEIRRELQAAVFGVWDHIKNHCTVPGLREKAATWVIDWIGHVPGKRESRRFEGDYILRQSDVSNGIANVPDDVVAFGGWPIDLHAIDGIYAPEPPCTQPQLPDRYGIPLRSLYSRTVSNLFLAGRNISQSHVAHASTRVMKTCAVIGEGVGVSAAVAVRNNLTPRQLSKDSTSLAVVQQRLLRQGAYLPGLHNDDEGDLIQRPDAAITATSEAELSISLEHGVDHPWEIYGLSDTEPKILAGHHQKHPGGERIALNQATGQSVVVSSDRIDRIALELHNAADSPIEVELRVQQANHLRDFDIADSNENVIATLVATVAPGRSTVDFVPETPIICEPNTPITLHLPETAHVSWCLTLQEPLGTQAGKWSEELGYWAWFHGTLGFSLSPANLPYAPANVATGMTRPEVGTNLWISDPAQPLPQSLTIAWDEVLDLNQIELTFDSQLSGWIWEGVFPHVVRDYTLEASDVNTGEWQEICTVSGNAQRRRIHTFDTIRTDSFRVTITATNGGRTARIFEVRAYHQKGE